MCGTAVASDPGDLFPAAPGASGPIILDWSVMWCDRHLSPYRAQWPLGAPTAMLALFHAAVAMPAVQVEAKHDAANLQAALERFAPVCCFVGGDALEAIYADTVPGRSDDPGRSG